MRKTILIVGMVILALGALSVGAVYAQGGNPPAGVFGGMMGGRGGYGPVHTYIVETLAEELDLTVEDINTRLQNGETMYEIALSEGIASEDLPNFLSEIHKAAFAEAVNDGVMTQAQADYMLQRMTQNGYGTGTCPMHGGAGYGRGMMGGRGGGQYQNQNQ